MDGDIMVRMCMIRRMSYYIQYTYNSSHKINLFSLSNSKSNNYKKSGTIIRKRGKNDDDDDEDTATVTPKATTTTHM